MKIGIFTFHFAKNYGAMLQAYALATAVRGMEYDCEIVDYRYPWMFRGEGRISLREHYALHRMRDNRLVSALKALRRAVLALFRERTRQTELYREFFEKWLPLSSRVHDWELSGLAYDALICGSDQIWNSRITGRLAAPYFLAFETPSRCRRIAYAASSGSGTFQNNEEALAASWLSMFDAIGVREKKLADTIRRLLPESRPEVVLDPTFLLPERHWLGMARSPSTIIPERFLLLYVVEETGSGAWIYDAAREIASRDGLSAVKIVRPCDGPAAIPDNLDVTFVEDCGPLEFLWLFSRATCVFAGSFHATVFSILFKRNFFCLPHPTDRERTDSLLASFRLTGRTLESGRTLDAAPPIDWGDVSHRLEVLHDGSFRFLKSALEGLP